MRTVLDLEAFIGIGDIGKRVTFVDTSCSVCVNMKLHSGGTITSRIGFFSSMSKM